MNLSSDRLCVEVTTKDCTIPPYECVRLQDSLNTLANLLRDCPHPVFRIEAAYHSESKIYHVISKLTWSDQTIFSRVRNPHLDTALEWCVRHVIDKTDAFKQCDNRGNETAMRRLQSHYHDKPGRLNEVARMARAWFNGHGRR